MMKTKRVDEGGIEQANQCDGHDPMALFEGQSFTTYCKRVWYGLHSPKGCGEHKYARLQVQRLWSPISAVVVPLLIVALLSVMVVTHSAPKQQTVTLIPKPPPPEKTREPEPELEKPESVIPDLPEAFVSDPSPTAADVAQVDDSLPSPSMDVPVLRNISPVHISDIFSGPTGNVHGKKIKDGGGTPAGESAVLRALRWLKKEQASDGSWEGTSRPAMTALALLVYLGHDELADSPEFGPTVYAATNYLLSKERDGQMVSADGHNYTLPICSYALCEAAAKIRHPDIYAAAERLTATILAGQCPEGGFAYNLKVGPLAAQDLSYTGWCIQALKTAKLADIGDTDKVGAALALALEGCRRWFQPQGDAGVFGYRMEGNRGNPGLTSVGVLCMQMLGGYELSECRAGMVWMAQNMPYQWGQEGPSRYSQVYYHYYATQVFFHQGGEIWNRWNRAMSEVLPSVQTVIGKEQSGYQNQRGTPCAIGSWDAKAVGERHSGGLVMDTCLNTLMLEVYYRKLGSYKALAELEAERASGWENGDDIPIRIGNALRQG